MPTEASAPAAESATPATTAETPATPTAPAAADGQAAQAPATVTAPAAAQAPVPAQESAKAEPDAIAESLAVLNREIRSAKAEREKYKGESTKLADRVARAELADKAAAALESKDFVTALRTLNPELSIDEAILTLIEQAAATDAKPLSQADIEKITLAKIEEDRRLQAEKVAADNKARMEQAENTYCNACVTEFQAAADSFPLIAQFGVSDEQIKEFTAKEYERERAIPLAADTLKHFEKEVEKKLTAAGYTKAQIAAVQAGATPAEAAKVPPVTATAPSLDTHGAAKPVEEKGKRETMEEYDKRVKAQLRALRQQQARA